MNGRSHAKCPKARILLILASSCLLATLSGCGGDRNQQSVLGPMTNEQWGTIRTGYIELFQNLDTNGDGFLSKAEYDAAHNSTFVLHDRDQNSVVELGAISDDQNKLYVSAPDMNGDGVIERAEHDQYHDRHFHDYLDLSGDGRLSLEEFLAVLGLE